MKADLNHIVIRGKTTQCGHYLLNIVVINQIRQEQARACFGGGTKKNIAVGTSQKRRVVARMTVIRG